MAKWSIPDLSKKIPANLLDPSLLEKVYIPNLVASLFTVNKAYAELIYNCTSSLHLLKVLHKWNEERWDTPKWQQKFACACSHQPELLQPAHPHSSPVFHMLCLNATHMANGVTRGIFDPSSPLNCYCTSLHPQCTGSKPRTCPLSNTSPSASLRSAHPQCSLAWLSPPSSLNTRPRMA